MFLIYFLIFISFIAFALTVIGVLLNAFTEKQVLSHDRKRSPVSIIIPFRNEQRYLPQLLNSLIALRRVPEDEIILVNDGSENVSNMPDLNEYPFIRIIHLDTRSKGSKKGALTEGIRQSRNDVILTSDADCIHREDWIDTMFITLDAKVNMVFGPVISNATAKNWVGKIAFNESLSLSAIGVGSSVVRIPILCSGANLLFRKQIWEDIGGYEKHKHIASGDDVLFMKDVDKMFPGSIRATIHPNAVVITSSEENLPSFIRQHRRWASKYGHIDSFVKIVWTSMLVIWMLTILPMAVISPIAGLILMQIEILFMILYAYMLRMPFHILDWFLFRFTYPFIVIGILLPFNKQWKK